MRPNGLLVLAALVLTGVGVTAGYLQWKAPEVGAIIKGRQAEIAAVPQTAAGRLAKWLEFGGPQVHHRLTAMRFSEAQPWLVTHAVGEDPGTLEIHGVDLSGMPRGIAVLDGLTVRVRLPLPRELGRGRLESDHAPFVPIYPSAAAAPNAVVRAGVLAQWALADLRRALEKDIPGASLSIEIGPASSWDELVLQR